MQIVLRTVVFGVIAAAFSPMVYAWDDVGHKATAYIAWQRMSPEARENVIRILRTAAEDSHLSAFYQSFGPEPEHVRKLEYFMLVSTWADIIRDRAFETRYRKYHKTNWHYDDIFWKQVNGKAEYLSGFEEGGVAVEKLSDFDRLIRNRSASDKDKAIAIAWIMHLAGDIHQPLHTSARVTDLEPKGDQGGNLFLLTPQNTPRENQLTLHWLWDSIIVRVNPLKGETCERDYVTTVARRLMRRHPFSSFGPDLKLGDYKAWRDESFKYAPTDVFSPDLVRFQEPSLRYKRNALRISERQIALAGYRLGELLNSVFTSRTTAGSGQCHIIRKIMYPVFKRQTPENIAKAKPTITLLDVCPTGPASRPTITVMIDGRPAVRTFDVLATFNDEDKARKYAAANSITDVSFALR